QQELADVLRYFRERKARLLTVTGIGGIGKTRLAKQAAAEMADEFPQGVWLVEMDALDTRDEILPAICGALRLETGPTSPEKALEAALHPKRLLLLLDCFELLKDHADLIEHLLKSAPGLRCLVTSRKVLGLPREFEYPLEPMRTSKSPGGRRRLSDSAALFAEAAGHVRPDFAVTSGNRRAVQELCELLEGIPLSI